MSSFVWYALGVLTPLIYTYRIHVLSVALDAYAEARLWYRAQFPGPVTVPVERPWRNVSMGGYLIPGKCAEYAYGGKKYITFQPDTLPVASGDTTEDAVVDVHFVYNDVTVVVSDSAIKETFRKMAGPLGDYDDQGKRVTLEQLLLVLKYLGQLPSDVQSDTVDKLIVNTEELEEHVFLRGPSHQEHTPNETCSTDEPTDSA